VGENDEALPGVLPFGRVGLIAGGVHEAVIAAVGEVNAGRVAVLKEIGAAIAVDPPDDSMVAMHVAGDGEDVQAQRVVGGVVGLGHRAGA
jgi:hypothetical protein